LVENQMLEVGGDIAQENKWEFLLRVRKLGFEIGKDIQFGGKGVPIVHVLFVASVPTEGFPLSDLKSGKIDFSFFPDGPVMGGEVVADDADQTDWSMETGGQTGKRGGATQKIGTVFLSGFNPVDADRSNDEYAHDF